jgi:Bacterial Ig domain
VGQLNTAHTGVITVSTAPIDSRQLEGEGKERRGGFQISPVWHNGRTEEHGAPMMLLLGALDAEGKPAKRRRELEGTAPLFLDHIGLYNEATTVDCQIDDGEWEALPTVLGARLAAFTPDGLNELWKAAGKARTCSLGVTAFRIRLSAPNGNIMRAVSSASAANYQQLRLAEARRTKMRVIAGTITINPTLTDPSRVSYIRLRVDGKIRALKNFAPFDLSWDTTRLADGEYFIEIEALDASGAVLASTPQRVFVLNPKRPMSTESSAVGE